MIWLLGFSGTPLVCPMLRWIAQMPMIRCALLGLRDLDRLSFFPPRTEGGGTVALARRIVYNCTDPGSEPYKRGQAEAPPGLSLSQQDSLLVSALFLPQESSLPSASLYMQAIISTNASSRTCSKHGRYFDGTHSYLWRAADPRFEAGDRYMMLSGCARHPKVSRPGVPAPPSHR